MYLYIISGSFWEDALPSVLNGFRTKETSKAGANMEQQQQQQQQITKHRLFEGS